MDLKKPSQPKNSLGQDLTGSEPTSNQGVKLDKFYLTSHFILLISITVLLVALLFFTTNTRIASQSNLVNKDRYQAVFLDNGEVYFGHIIDINNEYVSLTNAFYSTSPVRITPGNLDVTNLVLEKVGCEQHRPTDRTMINADNVATWQNLQDSENNNTIPGAIKEYFNTDKIETCEELVIGLEDGLDDLDEPRLEDDALPLPDEN